MELSFTPNNMHENNPIWSHLMQTYRKSLYVLLSKHIVFTKGKFLHLLVSMQPPFGKMSNPLALMCLRHMSQIIVSKKVLLDKETNVTLITTKNF